MMTIAIGTRTSRLARWQTDHIASLLRTAWPDLTITIVPFVTKGDRTLDKPLPEIGGKGLFTYELEQALRTKEIDIAVHSLKDLPVEDAEGLALGAIVGRATVNDVLISANGQPLAALAPGSTIGTSSLRRQGQLLAMRPDCIVKPIRGNVDTRIAKVMDVGTEYDAALLAAAGVERLALGAHIAEVLSLEAMLPAPGQGALAIQCRDNDFRVRTLLAKLECADVRACVSAERAFMHYLNGGCSTPVAAHATTQNGQITLQGRVLAIDGSREINVTSSGRDAQALGETLAALALAQGAGEILGNG